MMLRKVLFTCLIVSILGTSPLRADYFYGTTDYGQVQINDQKTDNNQEKRLYQVFNQYFGDEYYKQTGVRFNNSNDLYGALSITPESDRISVGDDGTVQAFYKDAAFGHTVTVLDPSTGESKAEFKYNDWTISKPSDPQSVSPAGMYDLVLEASKEYSRPASDLSALEETMKVGDPYWSWADNATMQDISLNEEFYFDPSQNDDGLIHMIMLDLSWYYDEPAFMVALEDMYPGTQFGNPDWDFNDGMYVFRSMEATTSTTPEPATALIFGLGLAGLPLARKWRKMRIA